MMDEQTDTHMDRQRYTYDVNSISTWSDMADRHTHMMTVLALGQAWQTDIHIHMMTVLALGQIWQIDIHI